MFWKLLRMNTRRESEIIQRKHSVKRVGAKYTSLEALILGGSEKGGNEEDWQVSE